MLATTKPRLQRQIGFSLVEVLVAIVVMSLGALGFAALQITGLSSNKSAFDRSQASILAYDIVDAMRSNRTAALKGGYDRTLTAAPPTGTTIAETDVSTWLSNLESRLPSGSGAISVTSSTGEVSITVSWDDSKGAQSARNLKINSRL
ncbi:type IV pilus modification protein PilV [Uliginosibacterium paludis]